jgi:hypothetical protein
MATDAMHHHPPARSSTLPRWMIVGFVAGALSVLIFHQGAWAILHAMTFTPRAPFPMQATQPLGVPQLWSLAFFGGIWGLLLAASFGRLDGARLVVASVIFGAILPTLVAWFVVAPLKGAPMAGGFAPAAMAFGLIVNAAWGLGTGLGLLFFGRPRGADRTY